MRYGVSARGRPQQLAQGGVAEVRMDGVLWGEAGTGWTP